MLLIIFGAGASYDSVVSLPPRSWRDDGQRARPPLADELFDDRPTFADAARTIHQFRPVLPLLRHNPDGLERAMQRLRAEAETNPERHRQLTAVRYYLQHTLWNISHDWRDVVSYHGSNYHTLLDLIAHHRKAGEMVALVTFNFDTLVEDALSAVKIQATALNDYIAHDYKVFKLHGSVSWAHPIKTPIALAGRNVWEVFAEIVQRAPELEVSEDIRMTNNDLFANTDMSQFYPAIALPP